MGADRRQTLAGLAALWASAAPAHAARPSEQPNVLWLVSEDNNPFIGAYGDPVAHTPALDSLAREGVLYRRAYSNAPVCAPSRFAILTGVYPEACAPAQQMRARASLPPQIRTYPQYMREAGYYCTNNSKTDYNCEVNPKAIWDDSSPQAHWRNGPKDSPFFAVFNFETTHESQLFRTTEGRVTPAMVRVPAYLPDTPDIRRDIASYYNLMEKMDGQIAAKLAELAAAGRADDTIVFYYSDNGGVLPRSKRYCYEEGLRCAMIVRLPPKYAHLAPVGAGGEVTAPLSYIDLAPTVLALAGLRKPPHMQGRAFLGARRGAPDRLAFAMRDRMDERYDMIRTVSDGAFRYIRNYMPHRPLGQHAAYPWQAKGYQDLERQYRAGKLDAAQLRFFAPKPFEELYDLEADPDQVANLADDPAHRARLSSLSRALDRHMLEINDNGFIPEGSALEGYLPSRAPGAYPLAELMRLGAAAARRDLAHLARFEAGLASPNEVVRYWAALGLLMLGDNAGPARAALEKTLREDRSPYPRIAAAEALLKIGASPQAVALLAAFADRPDPVPVRLMALNALTFVGSAAEPALPVIERAAVSGNPYVRSAGRYLTAVLKGVYDPSFPVFEIPSGRTAAG